MVIYDCLVRTRRRFRNTLGENRGLRPGDLVPYTYQLTKSTAAGMIQLCLWEGLIDASRSHSKDMKSNSKSGNSIYFILDLNVISVHLIFTSF